MAPFKFLILFLIVAVGSYVFVNADSVTSFLELLTVDESSGQNIGLNSEGGTDLDIGDVDMEIPTDEIPSVADVGIKEDNVIASEPLHVSDDAQNPTLTKSGVFLWTNANRISNGISSLSSSAILDSIAKAKLDDMFARQYFAHVSPSGDDVGDIADDLGYDYLLIGENLALGNFENDFALVKGWMDSPGHRANILKESYTEIGIAVGRGIYKGREVWIAVQSFGMPVSACPDINEELKYSIDSGKEELDELSIELDDARADITAIYPKFGPEYVDKVDEYNSLISEYNSLLTEVKSLISVYNAQVNAFNKCIEDL